MVESVTKSPTCSKQNPWVFRPILGKVEESEEAAPHSFHQNFQSTPHLGCNRHR